MINPLKGQVTKIGNAIGETRSAMKLFVSTSPKYAIGTAAAALLAPIFLSNDNRGYLQTAALTTPAITAFGMAAPTLIPGSAAAIKAGWGFTKSAGKYLKETKNPFAYKELRNFLDTGTVGSTTLEPVLSALLPGAEKNFMADRAGIVTKDWATRVKDVRRIFGSMTSEENLNANQWTLSYAYKRSQLRSMDPSGILTDPGSKLILENPIPVEDMWAGINKAISEKDEAFLSRFEGQMRYAGHMMDLGRQANRPNLAKLSVEPANLDFELLTRQRPELAEALSKNADLLRNAKMISQDLVSGKKVTQLILERGEDSLIIPVLDPTTGMVHVGFTNRLAAARNVWEPSERGAVKYALDVWLLKHADSKDWRELTKFTNKVVIGSIDKMNEYKAANSPESLTAILREQSRRMVSQQTVVTPFPAFGKARNKTWEDLTSEESMQYLEEIYDTWGSPINAEKGVIRGTIADKLSEEYTFGRLTSWERQSQAFRSFTKPMYLTNIPEAYKPYVTLETEFAEESPEMRQLLAGITPQEYKLFGSLPSDTKRLMDTDVVDKAVASLKFENKQLTNQGAREIWEKLANRLAEPGMLESARLAGGLGETNIIMDPRVMERMPTQSKRWVTIDDIHMPEDMVVGPNYVIGYEGGQEVLTTASMNKILKYQENDLGQYEALLEETFEDATGRKFNAAGIKGTEIKAESYSQFKNLLDIVNVKRRSTGGDLIPESVTAVVNELYFHDKLKEVAELLPEQAMEVYNRARGWTVNYYQDKELSEILTNYKTKMSRQHNMTFTKRNSWEEVMVENTKELRGLSYDILKQRAIDIEKTTREFTGQMSKFVRGFHGQDFRDQMLADPLIGSFLQSKHENILDYMFHNSMSISMSMWADARKDIPKRNPITQPLLSELNRAGLIETQRELIGRAEFYHADPEGMAKFIAKLNSRDYETPLDNVVSWEDAVPTGIGQKGLEGRTGFLNYNDPRFQKPFSIKLEKPLEAEGKIYKYIHSAGLLPGGTGVNMEQPGVLHTSPYEKSLVELTAAAREGGDAFLYRLAKHTDANGRPASFLDEAARQAFGKTGDIFRPRAFDPGAVAGRSALISTESPFDVMIGKGAVHHIKDDAIRAALDVGDVYGVIERFPTQSAMPVRVRVAKTGAERALLGDRMIGISNQLRPVLEADFDLDTLILHMMRPQSPAWLELKQSIEDVSSYSHMSLNNINWMYGNAEDAAFFANSKLRSLEQGKNAWATSLESSLEAVGNMNAVKERLASRYIGSFSNLVTESQLMLGSTPELMANKREMALMQHVLWLPRQGSIGALKGTQSVGGVDIGAAEDILKTMRIGLRKRTAEGANQYLEGLRNIAAGWKWEAALTENTHEMLGMTKDELSDALTKQLQSKAEKGVIIPKVDIDAAISSKSKFNIVQALVETDRVQANIEKLVTKTAPSSQISSMLKLLTQNSDTIDKRAIGDFFRIGNVGLEVQTLSRRTASFREQSAAVLGGINKVWSNISKGVGKNFKSAGVLLGAGLGVAALAGMATTPVGRPSANAFRPDEMAGVQDRNPGEEIAGSMAPATPPRRQLPPRPQTRTAMVAPVRQAVNLEVRAKAEDRGRSADLQRVVTQAASRGGSSYTNVNYVNGYNRLSKLRTRERIREIANRE